MKYYGKEKCRILKLIRAEIARNNEIDYVIEECPYQGNCKGTCPKCEAEVRELEQKLEARRKAGKRVAVAGVAAGMSLSVLSGCVIDKNKPANKPQNASSITAEPLMGDVAMPETTEPEDTDEPELMGAPAWDGEEPENVEPATPEPDLIMGDIEPDFP